MTSSPITNYRTRIKMAWLVLTGRAYAISYATVYQDYLKWSESAAETIRWSDMQDPTKWEAKQ